MLAWLERRVGTLDDFVFPSRIDHADHISTRQYARLVDEWMTGIELRREDYGTHSLRRTKTSIMYKQTGNLRAEQILLSHTNIKGTVRYLGVEVEDALALAEARRCSEADELLDLSVEELCHGKSLHTPGCAVAGYPSVTSASITSRSAVITMPLVSGPR